MPAAEALDAAGLVPLELQPKEGLALLNGTQMMTAVGALTVLDGERLVGTASVIGAMSIEALLGTDVAFAAAYHAARPHEGQGRVAAELRHLLRGSQLQRSHHRQTHKVQDPYSLRCVPQVHGASRDALAYARRVIEVEINSATDNPLVFPDGAGPDADPSATATAHGRVISGGNFHGQPVALALDFAKLAIAELGSISERRTALLLDARLSGLPPFLVDDAGLNSGLMLLQYTAAALVSEDKVLAHPASVGLDPHLGQPGRPCLDGLDRGPPRPRRPGQRAARPGHRAAVRRAGPGFPDRRRDAPGRRGGRRARPDPGADRASERGSGPGPGHRRRPRDGPRRRLQGPAARLTGSPRPVAQQNRACVVAQVRYSASNWPGAMGSGDGRRGSMGFQMPTAAPAGPAGLVYADVPNRIIAYIIDVIILAVVGIVVDIVLRCPRLGHR